MLLGLLVFCTFARFSLASTAFTGRLDSTFHPIHSYGAPVNAKYDYVVIGGGTAGLVVAARLAEDPSNSVAVIEAGGFYEIDSNLSTIPADDILYAGASPKDVNPLIDWGFVTVPQSVRAPRIYRHRFCD